MKEREDQNIGSLIKKYLEENKIDNEEGSDLIIIRSDSVDRIPTNPLVANRVVRVKNKDGLPELIFIKSKDRQKIIDMILNHENNNKKEEDKKSNFSNKVGFMSASNYKESDNGQDTIDMILNNANNNKKEEDKKSGNEQYNIDNTINNDSIIFDNNKKEEDKKSGNKQDTIGSIIKKYHEACLNDIQAEFETIFIKSENEDVNPILIDHIVRVKDKDGLPNEIYIRRKDKQEFIDMILNHENNNKKEEDKKSNFSNKVGFMSASNYKESDNGQDTVDVIFNEKIILNNKEEEEKESDNNKQNNIFVYKKQQNISLNNEEEDEKKEDEKEEDKEEEIKEIKSVNNSRMSNIKIETDQQEYEKKEKKIVKNKNKKNNIKDLVDPTSTKSQTHQQLEQNYREENMGNVIQRKVQRYTDIKRENKNNVVYPNKKQVKNGDKVTCKCCNDTDCITF